MKTTTSIYNGNSKLDRQVSLKSILIVLALIGVLIGGYFGYKYLIKLNTIKTASIITSQIGKMLKPIDGKCQILTISYKDGAETMKEQVVNVACVSQPEAAPEANPFIEPTPEPNVEIINP